MRKVGISLLFLSAALLVFSCGLYLGDLASIGGYDGFASEGLAKEFWYGKYSGWSGVVEVGAIAALSIGLLGAASSLGVFLFLAVKEITKHLRKVL
jgi:hypothetical protein